MNLLELLARPGVGNLVLFLTALVGVLGSFGIYKVRLWDRKEAARRAIKYELESMGALTSWVEEGRDVPAQSILTTSAYEAHLTDIGLLTDEEAEKLLSFYSEAELIDDMIDFHQEALMQIQMQDANASGKVFDKAIPRRKAVISQRLDKLTIDRWEALQLLKMHLGESHHPLDKYQLPRTEGDTLPVKHPFIDQHKDQLVSEGYFEEISDDSVVRLTEEGEEFMQEIEEKDVGL